MSRRWLSQEPGEVLGRQPEKLWIAPSKENPWYGTIRGDDRFTVEQVRALMTRGADPLTAEAVTVRRQADGQREAWWNAFVAPPIFQFECPVIDRRADGRIKVIAPSGDTKWVRRDGWAGFPDKRNWRAYQ